MRFTYKLQRENALDVSEITTAGRGAGMLFSHPLRRENEPIVSEMATAGRGGDAVHLLPETRERAGRQRNGNGG